MLRLFLINFVTLTKFLFGCDIQSLRGNETILPQRVDGAVEKDAIAALWKNKFIQVLNSLDDSCSKIEILEKQSLLSNSPIKNVILPALREIVKNLANNKAVGMDCIPNEFYKYAPLNLLKFLSITFNCFLHCFLPKTL